MGVFIFLFEKFYTLNMNLTFYESLGQSKKYRKLNKTGLNVEKILNTLKVFQITKLNLTKIWIF